MRTKTLAFSAMLGALGTASLVAQTNVYSINAVGYINLTLPVGFSIIACQLNTTNNTVTGLFNNSPAGPTPGKFNNCVVEKFNPADGHYDQIEIGSSSSYSSGWSGGGTMTLNPGEAVWFKNGTGVQMTNTFVGTVPQGTNTITIGSGFQMIASPVPFSGDLITNMGLTNYVVQAKVETFNNPGNGQYTVYLSSSSGGVGYMNQWLPGDPQVAVGQGFWYNSPAGATPWVQIFSINP